jgi:hypothetical protein
MGNDIVKEALLSSSYETGLNIWIVKAINSMKQRTTGHLFPIYCVSPLSNNIEILGTTLPTAPTLTEEYLPGNNPESLHCN